MALRGRLIDVESCCMVNWFYKMEAGVFPARQPKLEGWILDFKSSPFLYVLGFCVVGFIIVQSVFFLVRAWRRGKQLGMTTATLKNTVVSSALFTIAPALAIVATVLTLSKALGLVLPWIRLTVIGAIQYEVPAAEAAINAFGISTGLSQPVTDPEVFAAVAWVMTIGSILPLVIVPFALKKIQKSIGKVSTKDPKGADTMAATAFIGLIAAFIGRAVLGKGQQAVIGDGAGILSVATLLFAILFMLVLQKLCTKFTLKWLEPFAMPVSMFAAMGMAMLLANVLPPDIAFLEWRG